MRKRREKGEQNRLFFMGGLKKTMKNNETGNLIGDGKGKGGNYVGK